ncbi:MAG: hypothetical protein JW984_13820 [Deltaproteobacteria bacterium]|uniref:Uncharacterized protein n=1 Tax=Candidatus Zymogenus saltonus TaxID=2844893 RepID=A0A9D8KIK7_9DELT|nr:hypothetical protein [Candidatus Zymogenus saltonus]
MFLIDFINPYTVLFLVVVFVLAYLLKKSFEREILTPEGVTEELYPLIGDEVRFSKHFRTFLSGKRIEGTGRATGPPFHEEDAVTLTLKGVEEGGDATGGVLFPFEMKILFLRVVAPTEVKRDDVASFKGFLVGAEIRGRIVRLIIDISELTYVGSSLDLESDLEDGVPLDF